jgi:hypothetical protein
VRLGGVSCASRSTPTHTHFFSLSHTHTLSLFLLQQTSAGLYDGELPLGRFQLPGLEKILSDSTEFEFLDSDGSADSVALVSAVRRAAGRGVTGHVKGESGGVVRRGGRAGRMKGKSLVTLQHSPSPLPFLTLHSL